MNNLFSYPYNLFSNFIIMQHVIGVHHFEENLPKLVELIEREHSGAKCVMLELEPDWKELRTKWEFLNESYFYSLASKFEDNGTEVIAGDTEYYLVMPNLLKKIEELRIRYLESKEDKQRIMREAKLFYLFGKLRLYFNINNPIKSKRRDSAFLKSFDETKPDLTIVGCAHAEYIKKHRPAVNYTYFRHRCLESDLTALIHYPFIGGVKPDREIIVRI